MEKEKKILNKLTVIYIKKTKASIYINISKRRNQITVKKEVEK